MIKFVRNSLMAIAITTLPLLVQANSAETAKIITGTAQPSQCISPVHVNTIDGNNIYVAELGFDVEPGEHSLTGRAIIDTTYCRPTGISTNRYKVEPLTATFEAGKTYYVGYDHSSSNRRDWKLVIWKEEG